MTWFLALAGLALGGAAVQQVAEARDRRSHPAPGRLVQAGDATVHLVVQGSGPTVLVDSGLGGSSIEWGRVAAELAPDFTVVRYDRPGFAWSPGSRCDRRTLAAAQRIVAILERLDTPAILVGHSLGGLHVRLAAALRPDLVAGLVLVDPSHEGMLDVVSSSRAAALMRGLFGTVAWTAPLGLGRLAGRGFAAMALTERRQPLDPADTEGLRLSSLLTSRTVHGLRALAAENAALEASLRQFSDVRRSHPEPVVPLTVITAAAPSPNARVAGARSQIDAMHADLVASSPLGRHVLAERSGHLVFLDQPELVVQCVRETAKAVADGAWPTT